MNEHQWLTCTDPAQMFAHLQGKPRVRSLRLFHCACSRRIWHLLTDPRSRTAVEIEERYADGLATLEEAQKAYREARQVGNRAGSAPTYDLGGFSSFSSASSFYALGAAYVVWRANPDRAVDAWDEEHAAQCDLLRDVIGNPFRPAWIDPAWRTPTVKAIARAAYEERILPTGTFDPAHLPILADALEEAGCTDAAVLDHCRQRTDHVRGCWVVDALLAKA